MGNIRAGTLGFHGTVGQPTAQVIDGSLSFKPTAWNSGSQRLERTPGSSGNRRTWTWSAWVKRGNRFSGTNEQHLLDSRVNDDDRFYGIAFAGPQDKEFLFVWEEYSSGNYYYHKATPSFRDNGWYHLVVTVDTTQPNGIDRVKFYANGKSLPVAAEDGTYGWYAEDFETNVNQASSTHTIGSYNDQRNFDGYMCQNYLIDGLALGPGYFGFTDPLTGTWRPKKLKQGDPTVNDGTQWSSYITNSTGASNLFDGNLSTTYGPDGNTQTWTPPKPIEVISQLRIYYSSGVSSRNFEVNDNGNVVATGTGTKWVDLNFTGSLRKLSGTNGWNVRAIEIDGVILVDSTTTTVDFGTNGFYLPMDNEDDFEIDKSGKGNDYTKQNFSGTSINPDIVKDSPSGAVFGGRAQTGITTTSSAPSNYAVFNALDNINVELSDGNLKCTDSGSDYDTIFGTQTSVAGKHYYEVTVTALTTTMAVGVYVGNNRSGIDGSNYPYDANAYMTHKNGLVYHDGATYSYQSAYGAGDTVGVAIDSENRKAWVSVNGSYVDGDDPETGAGGMQSIDGVGAMPDGELYPVIMIRSATTVANFGQKPFKYAPPKGFLPLNSASARPNKVIPRPDQYVGVTTYAGDQSSNRLIEFPGKFAPDLVFLKNRDTTNNPTMTDTVRGAQKNLRTSTVGSQTTDSNSLDGFRSTGFLVGSDAAFNGNNMVAWGWKAGGNKNTFNVDDVGYSSAAAAGLDGGDITPTGASVGTKQGFSIIKWTGDGQAGRTISHGLSQTPSLIIHKSATNGVYGWNSWHKGLDNNYYIALNTNSAQDNSVNIWPTAGITNSVITTTSESEKYNNLSGQTHIAYIWHDVPGLQKFGSYKGNGSTDGIFVELGFRPAVVIMKKTSGSSNWFMHDSGRNTYNPMTGIIMANLSNGEDNSYDYIDFLSNGFKLRFQNVDYNTSSATYIYMAWAEAPASNLFGGQSTGR